MHCLQGHGFFLSVHKSQKILRGPELVAALTATTVLVRWILASGKQIFIDADAAQILVKQGIYEGKARSGRVYYIREVDPRPKPVCDFEHFRDRGMLLLHWGKPVDGETVKIWLRALRTLHRFKRTEEQAKNSEFLRWNPSRFSNT